MKPRHIPVLLTIFALACDSGPGLLPLPLEPEVHQSVVPAPPGDIVLFGPVKVTRNPGQPQLHVLAPRVSSPAQYLGFELHIVAEGPGGKGLPAAVPSARVILNGAEILGPSDLPKEGRWTVSVLLNRENTLEVTVLGVPGASLTLTIRGFLKPVAEIVLTPTHLELQVSKQALVVARALAADGTVLSGRAVTWSVDDPSVASVRRLSVNSGYAIVRGLSPGTTRVMATVDGVQGSAQVVVLSPELLVFMGSEIFGVHGAPGDRIAVIGRFSGTRQFGSSTLTSQGQEDVFAVMLEHDGTVVWATQVGSTVSDDTGRGAVDQDGNVFVVGFARAGVSVQSPAGGGSLAYGGGLDGFLVKLRAADGGLDWGMALTSAANDLATSVASLPGNDVMLGGMINGCCPSPGSATLRCTTGATLAVSAIGFQSGFVARIGADGTPRWVVRGGSRDMGIGAIATGPAGEVYFGGDVRSSSGGVPATFVDAAGQSRTVSNPGIGTGFMAKVDAAGMWQWGIPIGNDGSGPNQASYPSAIRVLPDGTVAVAGLYWAGGLTFRGTDGGSVALATANGRNAYLGAYDAAGRVLWGQRVGLSGESLITDILPEDSGTFLVGGYFDQAVWLGSNLTTAGDRDMFLARVTTGGSHQMVEQYGTAGYDALNGLGRTSAGHLLLGGVVSQGTVMGVTVAGRAGGFVRRR